MTTQAGINHEVGVACYQFKVEEVTHKLVKLGGGIEIVVNTIKMGGMRAEEGGSFCGPTIGFYLVAGERLCVRHGRKYNLQPAMGCEGGFQCPLCKGGALAGRAREYWTKGKGYDQLCVDVLDAIWTKTISHSARDDGDFDRYGSLYGRPEKIVRISTEDFGSVGSFTGLRVIVRTELGWRPLYSFDGLVDPEKVAGRLEEKTASTWEQIGCEVIRKGNEGLDGWALAFAVKDVNGAVLMVTDRVRLVGGKRDGKEGVICYSSSSGMLYVQVDGELDCDYYQSADLEKIL